MSSYAILFPAFCNGLREPDPEFYREWQALETLGIPWRVVNIAALELGDVDRALKFFAGPPVQTLIYRGWILHPQEYAAMAEALAARGFRLLTSPAAYCRGAFFPEFFPVIADHSFPAAWIYGDDPRQALDAARTLGPPPYFIKDFAKSAKEDWPQGCVVDSEETMAGTIRELREFRGARFEGGIVIRPLLRLRYLDENPFGGNIYEEYRLFFFRGTLISQTAYDRIGGDGAALPDYQFLAERIDSPFFTADIVVTAEGKHYVLEAGDGGVSGLPPQVSALDFHTTISRAMAGEDRGREDAPS